MSRPQRHGHKVGGIESPTYRSWRSMRTRCFNPNHLAYSRYGGAGVTVCERWESFDNFLADMGERPPGTSLGRHNDVGNYQPGNCSWQTPKEQGKRGAVHSRAKLTEEQVMCARALHTPNAQRGRSTKNMAADLGVSAIALSQAIRGVTWSHI